MQLATKQGGHSSNYRKLNLIMAAHSKGQVITFCRCGFYFLSSLFFAFLWFLLPSATCNIHIASKSCVLLYWQRYCTTPEQCVSAKLCGV